MPWGSLILTVLFGVIYANRLMDKGFHRLSAPYAADVKNSDAQRIALLEGITNEKSIYENIKNIKENSDTDPCQQAYVLERSFGLIDCLISTEAETNSFLGKLDDTANLNGNSRDYNVPLNSIYASNEVSGKSNNGNSKIESFLKSDIDIPKDMGFLRSSLPQMSGYNIDDNYDDVLDDARKFDTKRGAGTVSTIGCDCKIKNDLLDLGQQHFPRYLLTAVCQSEDNLQPRCWRGICKPLQYKVKVLTFRTVKDYAQKDPAMAWLPDDLRQLWKFKTVTVAAGCFCANG